MHQVADVVQAAVGIPLLHVGDVTADAVRTASPRRADQHRVQHRWTPESGGKSRGALAADHGGCRHVENGMLDAIPAAAHLRPGFRQGEVGVGRSGTSGMPAAEHAHGPEETGVPSQQRDRQHLRTGLGVPRSPPVRPLRRVHRETATATISHGRDRRFGWRLTLFSGLLSSDRARLSGTSSSLGRKVQNSPEELSGDRSGTRGKVLPCAA